MRRRIPLYDKAKGIGIILVIYGHLFRYGSIPFSIIFSFHMPLFFIISGMLFSFYNKKLTCIEWGKKIIARYFLPFFFFSFLGGIAKTLLFGFPDFKIVVKEFYYLIGSDELMTGALWFLGLLAVAMFVIPFMIKLDNHSFKRRCGFVLVLSFISVLCGVLPVFLPFRLKSASAVVLFVYIGYIVKDYLISLLTLHIDVKFIILSFILFVMLILLNGTVNIAIPVFNNFLIYVYCALYGSFLIFYIVSRCKTPSLIEYIGKHSLIIFSIHAIWMSIYTSSINRFFDTSFKPMVNMPLTIVLIGGLFVLFASLLTVYVISPVYNWIYKRTQYYLFHV